LLGGSDAGLSPYLFKATSTASRTLTVHEEGSGERARLRIGDFEAKDDRTIHFNWSANSAGAEDRLKEAFFSCVLCAEFDEGDPDYFLLQDLKVLPLPSSCKAMKEAPKSSRGPQRFWTAWRQRDENLGDQAFTPFRIPELASLSFQRDSGSALVLKADPRGPDTLPIVLDPQVSIKAELKPGTLNILLEPRGMSEAEMAQRKAQLGARRAQLDRELNSGFINIEFYQASTGKLDAAEKELTIRAKQKQVQEEVIRAPIEAVLTITVDRKEFKLAELRSSDQAADRNRETEQ
jgi:hypothetical protein